MPISYRASLAGVAFALVLLPVFYIGLIALVGYGMYWYAKIAVVIFEGSGGGILRLVAYIAPLFAGTVLIAFMIKPLVPRRAGKSDGVEIDLEQQPVLRDLIHQICHAVGAPIPVLVEVDTHVNAGARLHRGFRSLARQELALRIGLPLLHGLSTRQLAGVLAHEFGHFSQRAGMAFTFVIRSINEWFARVVFERDDWDAGIERHLQSGNTYVIILFACARAGLAIARLILRGLMMVGHAISCLQLRQMEYDADYYEVELAGTDAFVATAREMNRLNVAAQIAFNEVGDLWQRRQAVDDLAALVALNRSSLAPDLLQKVDAQMDERTASWSDTHPSDTQRIIQARSLASIGIFDGDGPATDLMCNLEQLSRLATFRFYEARALTVSANAMVPAAKLREANTATEAANAAWDRLSGTVANLSRPLTWTAADFTNPCPDGLALAQALRRCRSEMAQLRIEAAKQEVNFGGMHDHVTIVENACGLLRHGVKIQPRQFRLSHSDLTEAEAELADARKRLAERADTIAPFENAVRNWITLVGMAARSPSLATGWTPEVRDEVIRLTDGLVAHAAAFRQFDEWLRLHQLIGCYVANQKFADTNVTFANAIRDAREHARDITKALVVSLEEVPNPFPTPELPTSGAALRHSLHGVDLDARLLVVMRQVAHLYFHSLSRIALHGETLENSLAPAAPPLLTA